jgi:hypothetical protein
LMDESCGAVACTTPWTCVISSPTSLPNSA